MRTAGGPAGEQGGAGGGRREPDGGGGAAWTGWMADAACAGVGAGEFFSPDPGGVRWCRRCGVIDCCFWWAVVVESEAGYRFGVWGGATPAVRERVTGVTGVG